MVLNAIRFLLCNLIAEMESRTEGSRPRLRTQKKIQGQGRPSENSPFEAKDKNARGQGHGPRTQTQVFFKKKQKGLQNFFSGDLQKNGREKSFSADLQNFNHSGQFTRT